MNFLFEGIEIIGAGNSLPSCRVSNKELFSETADWVKNRLGIIERRMLKPEENLISLCEEAATAAFKDADIDKSEVSGVIVCTSTPDQITPSMAAILHGRLNLSSSCVSMDIQAVCAGFVHAFVTASALLNLSQDGMFLIVGADQFSKITDFSNRNAVFFGDAAAAILIRKSSRKNRVIAELKSEGKGYQGFLTPIDTRKFLMNSKEVYVSATTKLPSSIKSVCDLAGIRVNDIRHFFTHQPSAPVLDALQNELEIPDEKFHRNLAERGNTANATIPLLFSETKPRLSLIQDDWICFAAIGSGWVWGSIVMQW